MGVAYLELRFGPATHAGQHVARRVIAAAADGLSEGPAAPGMPAGLVACALRHHDPASNEAVARAAAARRGPRRRRLRRRRRRAAVPLAGADGRPFAIAAAAGLGLTAHAAEAGPAGHVRDAVETARCASHRARDPRGGLERSVRGRRRRASASRCARRRTCSPAPCIRTRRTRSAASSRRDATSCSATRRTTTGGGRDAAGGVGRRPRDGGRRAQPRRDRARPRDVAGARLLRALDACWAARTAGGARLGPATARLAAHGLRREVRMHRRRFAQQVNRWSPAAAMSRTTLTWS